MKVSADDLWPLILDFIESYFGEDDLDSFKKYFKVDIKHKVFVSSMSNICIERSHSESRRIASIISKLPEA